MQRGVSGNVYRSVVNLPLKRKSSIVVGLSSMSLSQDDADMERSRTRAWIAAANTQTRIHFFLRSESIDRDHSHQNARTSLDAILDR